MWMLPLAAVLIAAAPADVETEKAVILKLHAAAVRAHLDRDPAFFARERADDFVAVRRGEIQRPTRAETEAFFRRYLGRTRVLEYRDLIPPIVRATARWAGHRPGEGEGSADDRLR